MSALIGLPNKNKKLIQYKLRKIKMTKASFETRDRSRSYNRIRQGIPNINNTISKKKFLSRSETTGNLANLNELSRVKVQIEHAIKQEETISTRPCSIL